MRNQEYKNELDTEQLDIFKECDLDKDCLLNEQEYREYIKGYNIKMTARHGEYPEMEEEEIAQWYQVKNTMTKNVEGVSFDDLMGWQNIQNTILQEMLSEPRPTLGYWKIRGLASAIRY